MGKLCLTSSESTNSPTEEATQMKTELKAKFLQHLTQKKKDEGFTLIELLVVIIIIGILSAIALPSFLNQTAKARQSEARTNVGAMNRAQQAYYLEKQAFANGTNAITDLGIGISNSDNFNYSANGSDPNAGIINYGTAKNADLKSYAGGVFKLGGNTQAILCEANSAGTTAAADPTNASNCTAGTSKLN